MSKIIFNPGHIFYGGLVMIKEMPKLKKDRIVSVTCSCGNIFNPRLRHLLNRATTSCGCKRKQTLSKQATHGEANKNKTKEYRCWQNMKSRCTLGHRQYKDYGGRGIFVCEMWLNSYEIFLQDMGRSPSKLHSIERRDNNKGYYKENCYWGTKKEQVLNRRNVKKYEYNGVSKNLEEWSIELGFDRKLLWDRIESKGWSIEKAFTTPKLNSIKNL